MARVNIEAIIERLDSEMRSAMRAALSEVGPNLNIDAHELFRAFRRALRRKCSTWQTVPDDYVESD